MKIYFSVALLLSSSAAFAASAPREDLKSLTAQLAKTPSDDTLREKIIKLAATLKPAPSISKEARRPFVMAATYQKDAKAPADFDRAIKSYREALTQAPWWGDAYYNLSVVLESAQRYGEAKQALQCYLLTKPKDAAQVQDRIYALEAKENVASEEKANSPEARAAALYAKIEGARFVVNHTGGPTYDEMWEVKDQLLVLSINLVSAAPAYAIYDRSAPGYYVIARLLGSGGVYTFDLGTGFVYTYTVSPDGRSLRVECKLRNERGCTPIDIPRHQ